MPEIGTLGLMSGDGKRSAGHRPQATAPILDFTFRPLAKGRACGAHPESKAEMPRHARFFHQRHKAHVRRDCQRVLSTSAEHSGCPIGLQSLAAQGPLAFLAWLSDAGTARLTIVDVPKFSRRRLNEILGERDRGGSGRPCRAGAREQIAPPAASAQTEGFDNVNPQG